MVTEHRLDRAVIARAEDPHRPGSVDHAVLDSQVWLTAETRLMLYLPPAEPRVEPRVVRPWLEEIVAQAAAGCVHQFQRATALRRWVAAIPHAFPEGGRSTRAGFWGDFSTFLCGGAEEAVIHKGSPFAAELCRVLVTLAALAGLPGRIVSLYAEQPPFRHTICELWIGGRWTVFDVVSDRCFIWPKHGYASAWDLRQMPALIDGLQDHGRLPYIESRFYRTAAIAAYDPWDATHRFPWDTLDPATAARLARGEAA